VPAGRVAPKTLRALVLTMVATASALALAILGAPAHADPSAQQLDDQINAKSLQFNKVVEQYDQNQTALGKTKAQVAALQKQMQPMQTKVDAAQTQVNSIASMSYRGDKASALNAVLTSGSPGSMLDSLSMLDMIARNQSQQITTLTRAEAGLAAQKQKLDGVLAQQTKQQTALATQKASLQKDIDNLSNLRTQKYGSATNTDNTDYGPAPQIPGSAGQAVSYAWSKLGDPYSYGAAGPNEFDCSGLTMAAWSAAGRSLDHNTVSQYNETARISRGDLQPGDLVFYYDNDHVAIYIGNGTVIHAPTYGEPVQKAGIDSMPANSYGRVR
jgi:cell wall-associated NlpC family hydrolase